MIGCHDGSPTEEGLQMIIVEGPDGAGKTTLVKELSAHFNIPIEPRVVSKDAEAMVDLKMWTERNVHRGFQYSIFDRHRLISEPIYGAVLRRRFEPGFDDPQWLYLMYYQLYMLCRPVIIYCLPPYKTVRANILHDEDNKVVRNSIRRIYALYVAKAAHDAVTNGALIYNFEDSPSIEPIHIEINKSMRSENARAGQA